MAVRNAITGVPTSKSSVIRLADRESWPRRPRQGRGGGWEYLPPEPWRTMLAVHEYKQAAPSSASMVAENVEAAARQTEAGTEKKAALRRDAKLHILGAWERFRAEGNLPVVRGMELFCVLYGAMVPVGKDGYSGAGDFDGRRHVLAIPAWVRGMCPSLCVATLANWRKARDQEGDGALAALAGAYGNRRDQGLIDQCEPLKNKVIGMVLKTPHWSGQQLRNALLAEIGEQVEVIENGATVRRPVPSVRNLQRWVAQWKERNKSVYVRETNPDKWRSGFALSLGDEDGHVERLLQEWQIDASPADLLLTDGRYQLYVLVDLYSRRMLCHVTKTAKTGATLVLIRRALTLWGVPEVIRTDEGSDFTSEEFERAMSYLGITHDVRGPYRPEQKGTVEAHVKVVQHQFISLMPGYVGHSVTDRQKIRERKAFADRLGESDSEVYAVELTRDELQARLDDWLAQVRDHQPLKGVFKDLQRRGKSPFQIFTGYTGTLRRIDDERKLDLLLAPVPSSGGRAAGIRTVTSKGIRVEDAWFWDNTLSDPRYTRQEVFVRMDPDDMGRIWVFDVEHERFICQAVNQDRAGLDRAEMATKAKAEQAKKLAEARKQLRSAKRSVKPHEIADAIIAKGRADNGNLVAFQAPAETHETPALQAAGEALRAMEPVQPKVMNEPERQAYQAKVIKLSAPKPPPPEDPAKVRYGRAKEVEARLSAGVEIDREEREWFELYRTSAEYRTCERIANYQKRMVNG
ncbi:MAG: transposase [Magnetococcales bacterium]|nr:transposase [Magnetococcales bacterium]